MKPPTALAHKGAAVEEWADLRFFRPVGFRIARALEPTGVSAADVTLWSVLIGVIAGHVFFYQSRWINGLGVLLFVVSDLLDSADGQVARLRGTASRFGRTLDGIGDTLRFLSLYLHLMARLVIAGAGWPGVLLVAGAGLSHSLQSAAADFVRNAFLFVARGDGELDLPEDLGREPVRGAWARFVARVYRDYVNRQAQLFPRSLRLLRLLRQAPATDALRREYQERQRPLLPLASWIGQNIRWALLALAAVVGGPWVYLWTEVTALNLVLAVLLVVHESNATTLSTSLTGDRNVYA